MDSSYYYQILDIGICYEKGRQVGKHWRIGERKQLQEECMFWQTVLDFIGASNGASEHNCMSICQLPQNKLSYKAWQRLIGCEKNEESSKQLFEYLIFEYLKRFCEKYKLPNYKRILEKKEELIVDNNVFEVDKAEELKIYHLMRQLLLEMQKYLEDYKDKEMVYRILAILHNLPKSMHGRNILNDSQNAISCLDALKYAQGYMTEEMKEKYKKYLE